MVGSLKLKSNAASTGGRILDKSNARSMRLLASRGAVLYSKRRPKLSVNPRLARHDSLTKKFCCHNRKPMVESGALSESDWKIPVGTPTDARSAPLKNPGVVP